MSGSQPPLSSGDTSDRMKRSSRGCTLKRREKSLSKVGEFDTRAQHPPQSFDVMRASSLTHPLSLSLSIHHRVRWEEHGADRVSASWKMILEYFRSLCQYHLEGGCEVQSERLQQQATREAVIKPGYINHLKITGMITLHLLSSSQNLNVQYISPAQKYSKMMD